MNRTHRYIAFFILTLLFFAGCGRKDEQEGKAPSGVKEIGFFTMQLRPTFDDYFQKLFSEFEKAHPGVKIKWMDYPAQDYDTKLLTSFMGKNPPDVINLTPQILPNFVDRNIVLPLEPLLAV